MDELELLLTQLSCGDDEQAEKALSQIAGRGSEAIGALEERLSNPEADIRWWAVRALAEIQDQRVPGLLTQALTDADVGVRWCAGVALRKHPSTHASEALLGMLADQDALTRRLAGDGLVAIGSPVVPQLLDATAQGNPMQRIEAARALAKIGDERSIPILYAALDDSSALVEYWASEGLEKMGVGMVFFKPE